MKIQYFDTYQDNEYFFQILTNITNANFKKKSLFLNVHNCYPKESGKVINGNFIVILITTFYAYNLPYFIF